MITVTLQEAKAKLNRLVEMANSGEDVVLLKGSRIVATIMPLSENDVEIVSELRDDQAHRFWQEVSSQRKKVCVSPQKALQLLKKI